jgi:hypothetical protein
MTKTIVQLYADNPIALDPGDLIEGTENTGTTPLSGAFKASYLMFNRYKITPSVASNDLILALKHEDGNDPSADRPLYFKIGNTLRACTAALSVTKADATNWAALGSAELATKEADLFCYLIWNTNLAPDAVDIFWSRVPYGRLYSDFSATTTNEKYAAINATAPAATDECVCIGRFAATLSAGAAYTFSVPTYTNTNLIHLPIFETRELSYIPTLGGVTITTGTITAVYRIVNKILNARVHFLFGASSAITGAVTISRAMGTLALTGTLNPIGICELFDSGSSVAWVGTAVDVAGTINLQVFATSGAYSQTVALSSTVPFTWATGDEITASFSYPLSV